MLANRIAIAKELLGERAVDHRDERRTQIVARGEHTTLDDRNPGRGKEVGVRCAPRSLRSAILPSAWADLRPECLETRRLAQRHERAERATLIPDMTRDTIANLGECGDRRRVIGGCIASPARQLERQHILGANAGVDGMQSAKAFAAAVPRL